MINTMHYAEIPASQSANGSSQLHQKHQPPVPLFDTQRQPNHGNDNNNNEDAAAAPEFIIDGPTIDELHNSLTERTSGCSVEQLEQINTSLVDYIWTKRGEWDRNKIAAGVGDAFNDVLEDIYSVQEVEPGSSQAAKPPPLRSSSFGSNVNIS